MSFNTALAKTLMHEGGYVNDPRDVGGETYQGISRKSFPYWEGWNYLDRIEAKVYNAIYPDLNGLVANLYYNEFWLKNNIDAVQNDKVQEVLFDWLVNSGGASKQVQIVLNNLGANLKEDGIIGVNTIKAINAVEPVTLVNAITNQRINYYQSGVESGWLDSAFLAGLTSRAENYFIAAGESLGKSQAQA